jgi:hypothetical protein
VTTSEPRPATTIWDSTEPLTSQREHYVDFLRAVSLLVVVVFHWGFTILVFESDSLQADNPIGSTPGVWLLTWVFQVMPLFFFVGGYAHWIVWKKTTERGAGWAAFVGGRLRRLLVPAVGVAGTWLMISLVISGFRSIGWLSDAIGLIIMPLWFLGIYAFLVLLAPAAISAHRRWGPIVLVWLAGSAAVFDVLRFAHDQEWAGLVNFAVIWGFCHQLGLHYRLLAEAPRQVGWMLLWSGLFALSALTSFGLYPRSMVGIPGDRFSNMGPPTLAIVALLVLQVGLATLLRRPVMGRLDRSRWAAFNELANRYSLPLYLFHTSGYALAVAAVYGLTRYVPPAEANAEWWLQRPLWLVLPALFTAPIIAALGRVLTRRRRARPAVAAETRRHDSERFW